MNLLMFNLAVDAEHVTLSFGLRWIEKLAEHFDRIDVITMYEGRHNLPPNVHVRSAGREKGLPLFVRVFNFYRHAFAVIIKHRPAVAFSHMIAEFSLLFAPLSKLFGVPSILWYAHGHVPRNLRWAHRFVDHEVSSTPEGFRLPSNKVTFIGQGIDEKLYKFVQRNKGGVLKIIFVGRMAPSKGQDLMIKSLANWRPEPPVEWRVTFVGSHTNESEKEFEKKLHEMAENLLPKGSFGFAGRLEAQEIAKLLAESDLSFNLSTTGSLDKTIVESMACGCCVFSCNDAFRAIARNEGFEECVINRDEKDVQRVLSVFALSNSEERLEIAGKQSRIAVRDHSIDGLILRLASLIKSFATKNGK